MSTPPFHVLVIDDEPDLRELYELSLLRAGYVVDTAASVTAAKELLSKKTFAAVITDMRLSDGLGIEVLQTLQALDAKSAPSSSPPMARLKTRSRHSKRALLTI